MRPDLRFARRTYALAGAARDAEHKVFPGREWEIEAGELSLSKAQRPLKRHGFGTAVWNGAYVGSLADESAAVVAKAQERA
jgi:hypothetical protein